MWTAENRPRYNRDTLRYPSDLTDEEWAHIEPLIPPGKRGGGKRRVNSPVMKSLSDQSVSGATMMTSIAGLPSMFATMAIARAASN